MYNLSRNKNLFQALKEKTRAVYLHIIHEWVRRVRQVNLRDTILRVLKLCLVAFILPVGIDVAYAAGIASDKESVLAIHPTTLGILLKLIIFLRIQVKC